MADTHLTFNSRIFFSKEGDVCVCVSGERPSKETSTVPLRPSAITVETFQANMDTNGLIHKLNKFVSPFSEEVIGDLCRKHGREYLKSLNKAAGWAVKSK
jgi:hypothetical protein